MLAMARSIRGSTRSDAWAIAATVSGISLAYGTSTYMMLNNVRTELEGKMEGMATEKGLEKGLEGLGKGLREQMDLRDAAQKEHHEERHEALRQQMILRDALLLLQIKELLMDQVRVPGLWRSLSAGADFSASGLESLGLLPGHVMTVCVCGHCMFTGRRQVGMLRARLGRRRPAGAVAGCTRTGGRAGGRAGGRRAAGGRTGSRTWVLDGCRFVPVRIRVVRRCRTRGIVLHFLLTFLHRHLAT